MKDKYNKIIATGLLALMIANFSACDELPIGFDSTNTTTSMTPQGTGLKGSIWDTLKFQDRMHYERMPFSHNVDFEPLPLTFLQDEGLLYVDENGKWMVNGKQPSDAYNPFEVYGYIDKNTDDNDVYLLIQYASGSIEMANITPGVYLATWQLKYTLDDDDYQTFLKLAGDYRIQFFIQEMDAQYQPEVISKSVIAQELLHIGSPFREEHWTEQGFPSEFVANIDYDNNIITYCAIGANGFCYYDIDMRKTNAWEACITKYGITEEMREQTISMKTYSTPVGECLSEFHVYNIKAGLTVSQAKEAFNSTDRVHKLEQIDVNSSDRLNIVEK